MKRYYVYNKVDIIIINWFINHCMIIMLSYNTLAFSKQYIYIGSTVCTFVHL